MADQVRHLVYHWVEETWYQELSQIYHSARAYVLGLWLCAGENQANAFSFENAYIRCFQAFRPHYYDERFHRKRFDLKTLEWIKTKTRTYRVGVDARQRIKMKTMTENIAGARVGSMGMELKLSDNVQFYRF